MLFLRALRASVVHPLPRPVMSDAIDPRWAWQPYRPSPKDPWDLKKAGHLYRRAAFGANWRQLQQTLADGPDTSINALLHGGGGQAEFAAQMADMAASLAADNEQELRAWWL